MNAVMKIRKVLIPATEQVNSHTVCGRICDHIDCIDGVMFSVSNKGCVSQPKPK